MDRGWGGHSSLTDTYPGTPPSFSRDRAALHNGETGSLQLEGFESDMRRDFLKLFGGIQESDTGQGALEAGLKALGSAGSDIFLWAPVG